MNSPQSSKPLSAKNISNSRNKLCRVQACLYPARIDALRKPIGSDALSRAAKAVEVFLGAQGLSLASGETIQQEVLQELTKLISKARVSSRSTQGWIDSKIYENKGRYVDSVFVRLSDRGGYHEFNIMINVGEAWRTLAKLNKIKIGIINKKINRKVDTVTVTTGL